jgi:hypothetical protein
MTSTKCPDCGLIEGHANRCYTDILLSRLRALEEVAERAKILVEAPNAHTKMKLADAVHELERVEINLCLFRDSRSKARGSS